MGVFNFCAVATGHKAGSSVIQHGVFITSARFRHGKAACNTIHIGIADFDLNCLPQREQVAEFQHIVQTQQVDGKPAIGSGQFAGARQANETADHVFAFDRSNIVDGHSVDRTADCFAKGTANTLFALYSEAALAARQCDIIHGKGKVRGNSECRIQQTRDTGCAKGACNTACVVMAGNTVQPANAHILLCDGICCVLCISPERNFVQIVSAGGSNVCAIAAPSDTAHIINAGNRERSVHGAA